MDIKTIIKKLDISTIKVFFLRIFDKQGLYDYILDKANTGVTMLLESNKDTVASIRSALSKINGYAERFVGLLPMSWRLYAMTANDLLLEIYNATEDNVIVSDEAKAIIEKFRIAYSVYKSDDIEGV